MAAELPGGQSELLIIAASARFLAASAAACGRVFTTVDGFADAEVRALAACTVRVPLVAGGLSGEAVRKVCARLMRERRFAGAVIGPGLDAYPELIEWLSSRLAVCGNRAEVFARCRDRRRFTARLRRLGIPHPSAGGGAPVLSKLAGASGGAHVRFGPMDAPAYRQAYLPGTAVSHLFLASRDGAASVGWNTQWQSRHDERRPFCYGGAINRSPLDDALRARTEDYAARLARDFSLVGINSADYVVCGDELDLLELNPRVSATMQLHDDASGTLFAAHLAACGSPPPPALSPQTPRAHAVLYASRPLVIQSGFDWPAAARDLPVGTVGVAPGEPLCTLTARAVTAADTLTRLQHSIRSMNARLAASCRREADRDDVWPVAGEARA